jgi:ketosteroid isomerase-like protein
VTLTEDANVRLAREHFAAESAHDHDRTLATLADDVVYRVVAAGVTLPPTGRRVTQHLCALIRVRDGRMVEETVYYDQLERIRQLGAVVELDGRRLELPPA